MSSQRSLDLPILQAERTVAAYLGFDSILDLQRFVIMWPCLEAVRLVSALPGLSSENFMFLRRLDGGRTLRCNHLVGPASERIQQCWLACILMILRQSIGVYETNNSEQNRSRTILAIDNMPPGFWIPDHILEEDEHPPYPILQPTVRFNEPEIVPLHRCLCLLQYLELSHGSESRRERYLDARAHYFGPDFEVNEHDIPWWMRHST
ncbi:hypothetical protein PENCOP_c009G08692 [Penicillium coprophilum]|uniref:Uncharacterized protein n=1 Tax=Penicillium coprophilum TaxID=36646 RepID=A0A1V6UHA1_9EURO|nr:hypothetical protein PENCOP_c009G08692 [Penicillium coprophilum]